MANFICSNCQKKIENPFFCNNCLQLQKSLKGYPNYFELFSLPTNKFTIDINSLSSRVESLLFDIHPDLFAQASIVEQRLALKYTTYIHEAEECLKSPVNRGIYLCKTFSTESVVQIKTSNDFLKKIFLFQEELEQKNGQEKEELLKVVKKNIQEIENELDDKFTSNVNVKDNFLEEISYLLGELKYWLNVK